MSVPIANDSPCLKLILHVGRHKTGTSSLQIFFAQNYELLVKQYGILYPIVGLDQWHKNHHPLVEDLVNHGTPINRDSILGIISEAREHGCHSVLLSSEMLARPSLSIEQLQLLKRAFSDFAEITIVIYLRKQDDFLESVYANRIRVGLLSAPTTIHDLDAALDYHQFVMRYAGIFGKDNIVVRSFDEAIKGSIYSDFLASILGIASFEQFQRPIKQANQRYSWWFIRVLRHANRSDIARKVLIHRYCQKLIAIANKVFPNYMNSPRPLTENERAAVLTRYQESNDRLVSELFKKEAR
jgi:hypothetical protein